MKKIFFLSAIALGLMTSCSEDEQLSLPSVDNNTIAFATQSANKPMTRSGATITSLSKFTVDAINTDNTTFFANVQYVYDNTQGLFISSTPYYWPTTNTLSFYAISDPGTVSRDANKVPHYAYADWAGEKDLVAATVLAGEKTIPYPLTFQHLLSQISVSAEAKDKDEKLTYKVTSIEMSAPCDGTYSFADATGGVGTWEINNIYTKEYSFGKSLPCSFSQTGKYASNNIYWNILPVTDGKLKFKVGYQVIQNDKVVADFTGVNKKICRVEEPNLVSGKRYIYNFLLTRDTEDVITFTTNMTDWAEGSSSTYEPSSTDAEVADLILSKNSLCMKKGETETVTIDQILPMAASAATVEWSSNNESVATVTSEGVITAVANGSAVITIAALDGSDFKKTVSVVVSDTDPFNNVEFVDLGLPSGAKWATMNVGATNYIDPGYLFPWGEIDGFEGTGYTINYDFFTADRYLNSGWGNSSLDLAHDAARTNLGGNWRMPSEGECIELINNTKNYMTTVDGIEGWMFESKVNHSRMFMPMNIYIVSNDVTSGAIWTTSCTYSNAIEMGFSRDGHSGVFPNGRITTSQTPRYWPRNIRGIIK